MVVMRDMTRTKQPTDRKEEVWTNHAVSAHGPILYNFKNSNDESIIIEKHVIERMGHLGQLTVLNATQIITTADMRSFDISDTTIANKPFKDVTDERGFKIEPEIEPVIINHEPINTISDVKFMQKAALESLNSTCNRLNVGAVLVKNDKIISTGFNTSIDGHNTCDEKDHIMYEGGCKRTIHAEINAILSCAKEGISTNGAMIYVTHEPCPECLKILNQSGIKEIVYKRSYPHRYSNDFAKGITIRKYQ